MDAKAASMLNHQATLTEPLRKFLYRKIGLASLSSVLDVGCGTGAISGEIASRKVKVTAVDIDPDAIAMGKRDFPEVRFLQVQKSFLPFEDHIFDLAFCHFVLMWQADPVSLLLEMARVVKPGGWIVAAAEPDYGGRVTHPDDKLTAPLMAALAAAGADPLCGRKLPDIFQKAALTAEVNVWPSMVRSPESAGDFEGEWWFYEDALKNHLDRPAFLGRSRGGKKSGQRRNAHGVFTLVLRPREKARLTRLFQNVESVLVFLFDLFEHRIKSVGNRHVNAALFPPSPGFVHLFHVVLGPFILVIVFFFADAGVY